MTVDGVLFDIDDTLVDTRGAFGPALAGIARRYLPEVGPDRDHEVLAAWRADAGNHFQAYADGRVGYREQRHARANALHDAFGGPELDEVAYAAWDELFEQGFSSSWTAIEDAEKVVDLLLEAGLAVGALSNAGSAYQASKLARAGLGDRVPMLVGVDTLGFGKPHPEVFLEACRRLGTEPARTVYVGDELDGDAVAAVRAGLRGIWLDRPGPRRRLVDAADVDAAVNQGVMVVTSLGEIPGLLGL
ncbi:HAD family hydrolase [Cellulomonas sp. P22]|uniref:HAD family hydrolase n=1 Tax=Cellulomonas sp. P22 TaxID=3373189 RepID=UPI0037B9E5C7